MMVVENLLLLRVTFPSPSEQMIVVRFRQTMCAS